MPHVPDDRRPALEPPQFRLRTLLWLLALACVLLAILTSLDAYGIFAIVMLTLSIVAHLLGAAIGHRLRDNGDHPLPPRDHAGPYPAVAPHEFAPTTKLSQRRRQNRLVVGLTIAWTLIGGVAGGVGIYLAIGQRANITNVTAGALAFAVLGAIWGFALSAFVNELWGAWREAQK